MAAIANKRELKKGPWTAEEDSVLLNYINIHGERNWNTVAHCAGLRRNGKSCRLRWLNYLRPDVRRGNITLQEQLLILQLHSLWGNRWSKIAQHLPGRTDNEIKNYWRTRVQKQAKQLNCDVNSQQFRDAMRHEYIPRLMERINTEPLLIAPSSPFTTTHRHLQVLPPRDFMPEITSGASSDYLDNQTSADYYNLLGEENKSCSDSWLDGRSNTLLELEKCFLTDDCIGPTWFV